MIQRQNIKIDCSKRLFETLQKKKDLLFFKNIYILTKQKLYFNIYY